MAQINSSGQSVPHACVICAPTIELALSEAEKLAAECTADAIDAVSAYEGCEILTDLAEYLLTRTK